MVESGSAAREGVSRHDRSGRRGLGRVIRPERATLWDGALRLARHDLARGRAAEGAARLEALLAAVPKSSPADHFRADQLRLELARARLAQGRPSEARALFCAVRDRQPDLAALAAQGLALSLLLEGRPAEALHHARLAALAEPGRASHHLILGEAQRALGRWLPAEQSFRAALALNPRHFAGLMNLGEVLLRRGRTEAALRTFLDGAGLRPDHPRPWEGLGRALAACRRLVPAEACLRRALGLAPQRGQAHAALAGVLARRGATGGALDHYRSALALGRVSAPALAGMARACRRLGDGAAACDHLAEAIRHAPGEPDLHVELGLTLETLGRAEEARESYGRALKLAPRHPRALWRRVLAAPPVLSSEAEAGDLARRFDQGLRFLERGLDLDSAAGLAAARQGALAAVRLPLCEAMAPETRRRFGALLARIMAARAPGTAALDLARPPAPGERVRVAVVSSHLCDHPVGRLFGGWVEGLDRRAFAVSGYHLGPCADGLTRRLARSCGSFGVGGALPALLRRLRAARAHVLLFPDPGTGGLADLLAASRLAPAQVAGWGHPFPAFLPTLDAFLTPAACEVSGAQAAHDARLIALSGLGLAWRPRPAAADPQGRRALRRTLSLEAGMAEAGGSAGAAGDGKAVAFLVLAPPARLPLAFDATLVRIAAEVPESRFLFAGEGESGRAAAGGAILRRRLEAAFAAAGLVAERHCRFLTPAQAEAVRRAGAADAALDPPGRSDAGATLEALAAGLPVVAWAGPHLAARLGAGALRQGGCGETVAATPAEYVALAVRLARDGAWRARLGAASVQGAWAACDPARALAELEAALSRLAGVASPVPGMG